MEFILPNRSGDIVYHFSDATNRGLILYNGYNKIIKRLTEQLMDTHYIVVKRDSVVNFK